jgi:hypothetical protein
MRHLADDVFITALAVRKNCAKIALRPGRHKQRSFKAEHGSNLLLQRIHRRIVAKHIIAEWRSHHRLAHRGRGLGDGIATQVNSSHDILEISVLSRYKYYIVCYHNHSIKFLSMA